MKEISGPPQWRDRAGRERIPSSRWGLDHWCLLLYVESRVFENQGQIDWNQMTLSRRHWPMLYAARNPWEVVPEGDAADRYGLRLKTEDGSSGIQKGLCEADALMDLVDEGLVTLTMPPVSLTGRSYLRPDGHALSDPSPYEPVTGRVEWALMPWARAGLTDRGWNVASSLRRYRGAGGDVARFSMPGEMLQAAGS